MIAIPNNYDNKTSNIKSTPDIPNPDSKDRTIKRLSEELAKVKQKLSSAFAQIKALVGTVDRFIKNIFIIKTILEELLDIVFKNVEDDQILYLLVTLIEKALGIVNGDIRWFHNHTRHDERDKNVPKGTVEPKTEHPSEEEEVKTAHEFIKESLEYLEEQFQNGDLDEEAIEPLFQTIMEKSQEMFDEKRESQSKQLRNSDTTGHVPSSKMTKYQVLNQQKKPTGNKPGGVIGHMGYTIGIDTENPDKIIKLYPEGYGPEDSNLTVGEKRFVIEEVAYSKIIEYDQMVAIDVNEDGKRIKIKADFPDDVKAHIQYGPDIQADVIALDQCGLSKNKISEYLQEKLEIPLSVATVTSIIQKGAAKVVEVNDLVKTKLKNEPIVHFDETTVPLKGKKIYVHTAVSDNYVLLKRGRNRGQNGADDLDVAKGMKGIAVSDRYSLYTGSYYDNIEQAFCHSHGARDLEYLKAMFPKALFPRRMLNCFRQMKHLTDEARKNGKDMVDPKLYDLWMDEYGQTLKMGYKEAESLNKKNKVDRHFINLLDSLQRYWIEWTRFFSDLGVPYTNNPAESALRPLKISAKVSGSFRSEAGLDAELALRSYTQTAIKQGLNPITALQQAVMDTRCMLSPTFQLKKPQKENQKLLQ